MANCTKDIFHLVGYKRVGDHIASVHHIAERAYCLPLDADYCLYRGGSHVDVSCYFCEAEEMNKYNKIINMSPDAMAAFILTIIVDTENSMLEKLAIYGLDVDIVRLDPIVRQASILKDLLEDEHDT